MLPPSCFWRRSSRYEMDRRITTLAQSRRRRSLSFENLLWVTELKQSEKEGVCRLVIEHHHGPTRNDQGKRDSKRRAGRWDQHPRNRCVSQFSNDSKRPWSTLGSTNAEWFGALTTLKGSRRREIDWRSVSPKRFKAAKIFCQPPPKKRDTFT